MEEYANLHRYASMLKIAILLWLAAVNAQRDSSSSLFNQHEAIPLRKSKEVPGHMDLKVNPCHDFYEFACGSWTHVSSDNDAHGPLTSVAAMNTKIDQDLRHMLQDQVKLEDKINGRKLKDFYRSCMLAERNGAEQETFFSKLIQTNGGFPAVPGSNWYSQSHNYNWQDVIGNLRFQYDINILVGLKIDVNYIYPAEDSIYLGAPDTIIPSELCNTAATQKTNIHSEEYNIIVKEITDNMHMWLGLEMDAAKKLATELLAFEYELCTAIDHSIETTAMIGRAPQFFDQRKTLYEFTHQFHNNIDFVATTYRTPIAKPAIMTDEAYFNQLIKTVNETNKATIANYIMYRALSTLSFPHDDKPSTRPSFCLNLAKRFFPKDLGQMYYRVFANVAAKDDILDMFYKLKESFLGSFQQTWLEDITRRTGETRLSEIDLSFAKYDRQDNNDLQINRTNYWHNLLELLKQQQREQFQRIFDAERQSYFNEVEAYDTRLMYRKHSNRIEIGFGLLQEPLYHQSYPNAIRYAVIGQRLAYTLAVAFDDIAWGSDRLYSWDHITKYNYQNRSECFRQQIGNYLYNNPDSFNNVTQLREAIAMSGGLNVAFNAYLNWLAFLNPNNDFGRLYKETLPEFNFTNTQLFFISFAQMYCSASNSTHAKVNPTFSPFEKRSIERFAVNGPLRNFVEFARDFGCTVGVEMNPPDKCVIY